MNWNRQVFIIFCKAGSVSSTILFGLKTNRTLYAGKPKYDRRRICRSKTRALQSRKLLLADNRDGLHDLSSLRNSEINIFMCAGDIRIVSGLISGYASLSDFPDVPVLYRDAHRCEQCRISHAGTSTHV